MIPILGTSSRIFELKIDFETFAWAKLGGKSPEVLRVFSKDPLVNLEHFDTSLKGAADCVYMILTQK